LIAFSRKNAENERISIKFWRGDLNLGLNFSKSRGRGERGGPCAYLAAQYEWLHTVLKLLKPYLAG